MTDVVLLAETFVAGLGVGVLACFLAIARRQRKPREPNDPPRYLF